MWCANIVRLFHQYHLSKHSYHKENLSYQNENILKPPHDAKCQRIWLENRSASDLMQANFPPHISMHSTAPSEHSYDSTFDFPDASDKSFLLRQIFAVFFILAIIHCVAVSILDESRSLTSCPGLHPAEWSLSFAGTGHATISEASSS